MKRQLSIRVAGPGVPEGKFALRDLQRIVHPLEQAVQALLPPSKPAGSKPGRARRPDVQFLLSGIEAGSAIATGEMDTDIAPTFESFELEPLDLLLDGMNATDSRLPRKTRQRLDWIAQNLPTGVDFVELSLSNNGKSARLYRRDPDEPTEKTERLRTLSGRLISINFRVGSARLEVQADRRRKTGPQLVPLRFPDELANDVQRCARQQVSIHGIAVIKASGTIESFSVQRIRVELDDRRGLWAPKRFQWPTAAERLDNVDMQAFLQTSREDDEEDV